MPLSLTGPAPCAPLSPHVERWVAERAGLGYADTKRDESAVREMLASLGWSDVADLDPETAPAKFREYLTEMTTPNSPRLVAESRKKWSGRTRNKMQSHMSGFVQYLIEIGELRGRNWVRSIKRHNERDADEGKTCLTPKQFWALHAKTIERGAADEAAMFLAFWRTGMRPSDWRDLERRHLGDSDEAPVPVLLLKKGKTRKFRPVPLAPDVVEWFQIQAHGKSPSDKLLPEIPDLDRLRCHIAAIGLDESEYGYSSFRKGFACDRALARVPESVVQKTLGHTTSKTTSEFYLRFSGAQLAESLGFAAADQNPGTKSLDERAVIADTPVASSAMFNRPSKNHDVSDRASAPVAELATLPGVEARSDAPCFVGLSGPGLIAASFTHPPESHLGDLNPRPMLYESTGTGIRLDGGAQPQTSQIVQIAERTSADFSAAVKASAPRPVQSLLAALAASAWAAVVAHLGGNPGVPHDHVRA